MVKEEMHLHEIIYLTFFPWPKNVVVHYPLHHVTYAATKFKIAAANGLWEDKKLTGEKLTV